MSSIQRVGPTSFVVFGLSWQCPDNHSVRTLQVMLEGSTCVGPADVRLLRCVAIMCNTNDKAEWPENGSQPIVLSTGDKQVISFHFHNRQVLTSISYCVRPKHADCVFGCKGDALQQAIENGCRIINCRKLKSHTAAVRDRCFVID